MTMETYYLLIGAIAGFSFAHLIGFLFQVGNASNWLKEAEGSVVKMLVVCVEACAYIMSLKQRELRDMGAPESTVKLTEETDKFILDHWKKMVIERLNESYSKRFQSGPRFYDWTKLMEYVNQQEKAKRNEKSKNDKTTSKKD
jgi:hypothetical protein